MKKLILFISVLLCFVCIAGCKEEDTPVFTENNNVHINIPSDPDAIAPTAAADNEEVIHPSATQQPTSQQPTSQEATEVPTQPGPVAQEEYRNEYTADGKPSVVYEVAGNGENATYTGIYTRYVYNSDTLSTCEKWSKSKTGDVLISTVDYIYDGRGTLTRTDERIPDSQGNLYTYCLTEYTNNTEGNVATKSISYLDADGTTKQQTVYGYTYDDYGRQTLCTVTEDGSFTSSSETEYILDGRTVIGQTETTTKYPNTPYEQKKVLTKTFDTNGNILSVSEDDTGVHYTITYEYDSQNREVGSRTVLADNSVSEYTTTHYEDLGGGCTRITKRLFTADGSLYSTQITCLDAYGNTYIPVLEN